METKCALILMGLFFAVAKCDDSIRTFSLKEQKCMKEIGSSQSDIVKVLFKELDDFWEFQDISLMENFSTCIIQEYVSDVNRLNVKDVVVGDVSNFFNYRLRNRPKLAHLLAEAAVTRCQNISKSSQIETAKEIGKCLVSEYLSYIHRQ